MPRGNFIDKFLRYTEGKGSPSIYRKWTAIFLVSAVLERKVWMNTGKGRGAYYANQYIILVGPAGIGKSLCTNIAYDLLDAIRTPETPLHIAPSSVTKASLIDRLADADRRIVRPMETPAVVSYNALTIIPNELGVFLPAWDGEFMSTMTDLWDCKHYSETRRTRDLKVMIPRTQLNMLSATTPSYLNNLLPEGAWETGFMARALIVFSGENIFTELFKFEREDNAAWDGLVADLRAMYKLYGEFDLSDDAIAAINEWGRSGGHPIPDHPKLMTYRSRRLAHLLKLTMVASAASSDTLKITLDNFAEALDWLVELETFMPDVFKSMKTGGDGRAIEECWHYAYTLWCKHKEPVPEPRIIAFLQERVPVHNIDRILDVMCRAGLLTKQLIANGHGYVPKALKAS